MNIAQLNRKFTLDTISLLALAIFSLVAIQSCTAMGNGATVAQSPIEPAPVVTPVATPAAETIVTMNLTDETGVGEAVGTVTLKDAEYGLMITPNLTDLSPGIHGFHVHANAACGPGEKDGKVVPGLAAGGHYDPAETGSHEGPYGDGHLGDLPPLYIDADGNATTPTLAPRLTVADVSNRALMIHLDGDNFSDEPAALGGGGARLACGVIKLE
ncbi:MAG: superoxide dismutase [Cu-Zn] SodC [Phormidesmis sp.]